MAANATPVASQVEDAPQTEPPKSQKRKRDPQPVDEIDEVFSGAFGKRVKKAALPVVVKHEERELEQDELGNVLKAIQSAPSASSSHSKKKKKKS
jgi:hypothetical protein